MRIDCYQEVEIVEGKNTEEKYREYIGRKGVVMGISEEDGVVYGYAVDIYGDEHGMCFDKDEVVPTGVRFKREDFYDGSRARVSSDGELLEVSLVDELNQPPRRMIKFVPQKDYDPERAVPEGPHGGYWDRFDNEWLKVATAEEEQEFAWEVILSERGQKQYELYTEESTDVRALSLEEPLQRLGAKFAFYQEVSIKPSEYPQYADAVGVVFAIGADEGPGYSYLVHLPAHEVTISCWETALEATGKFFQRDDFFDKCSLWMRLSQDGELLGVYVVEMPANG